MSIPYLATVLDGVCQSWRGSSRPACCVRPARAQHKVFVDDDASRKSWPDGQSGLDVEVTQRDLLADLADALLGAARGGDHDGLLTCAAKPTTSTFRHRLTKQRMLIGSFVKTPAISAVEIAGLVGLDFVVLDQEHAALTVRDIDLGVLAGRATGIDVLVRVPSGASPFVQQALDLGAAGIVVPHVDSPEVATAIVAAARFVGGERGYSNSQRYGAYGGSGMGDLLASGDAGAAVILQIEDAAAVDAVEQIAAVSGVDALFIGRADLTVAFGANADADTRVAEAAARIGRAAERNGLATGTFYPNADALAAAACDGLGMVILGSDQSMLRSGWSSTLAHARALAG